MAYNLTHLSLFSGIGGIDLAAEWAGFESVAMVERDKYCQKILAKNFPNAKIYEDVLEFNGNEYRHKIDIISAGFPCQPFSLCGKREGASDERALWPEVVRIISEVKPKWFLGENVPGLLASDRGNYFGTIINSLDALGYRVGWCCYGAKDVGAVHKRDRVFIVAHTDSKPKSQTDQTKSTIGNRRNARHDAGRRNWQPVAGGDWRKWNVRATLPESAIRRNDDGFSDWVDSMRALGNAVVPQQVYPILAEIAKALQEEIDGI